MCRNNSQFTTKGEEIVTKQGSKQIDPECRNNLQFITQGNFRLCTGSRYVPNQLARISVGPLIDLHEPLILDLTQSKSASFLLGASFLLEPVNARKPSLR